MTQETKGQGATMPSYQKMYDLFFDLGTAFYTNSYNHGFWDDGLSRNRAEMIALMHSELSEMLEGVRKPGPDSHIPEHQSEVVEAADLFIRLMDYVHGFGYTHDFVLALIAKHQYNVQRPHKHGKAF